MIDAIRWELFDQSVRGFLMEKHVPWDTADEWTDEIVAIAQEQLGGIAGPRADTPPPAAPEARLAQAEALLDAWCTAAEDGEALGPLREQTLGWLG